MPCSKGVVKPVKGSGKPPANGHNGGTMYVTVGAKKKGEKK